MTHPSLFRSTITLTFNSAQVQSQTFGLFAEVSIHIPRLQLMDRHFFLRPPTMLYLGSPAPLEAFPVEGTTGPLWHSPVMGQMELQQPTTAFSQQEKTRPSSADRAFACPVQEPPAKAVLLSCSGCLLACVFLSAMNEAQGCQTCRVGRSHNQRGSCGA